MIELYHNDISVCAQKVRFALAEKKIHWELCQMLACDKVPEIRRGVEKLVTVALHCVTRTKFRTIIVRRSWLGVNKKSDATKG